MSCKGRYLEGRNGKGGFSNWLSGKWVVNFEYYEKQLSKNLVKSIFPKYTLKTLCVSSGGGKVVSGSGVKAWFYWGCER